MRYARANFVACAIALVLAASAAPHACAQGLATAALQSPAVSPKSRVIESVPSQPQEAPTAIAEANGVKAKLSLSAPRGWQPGVPIDGLIEITLPEGARIEPPSLPPAMGAWDVRNARLEATPQTGARNVRFSITAWESGEVAFPPVPLSVVLQDGKRVELAVGPVDVTLQSLLANDTDLTELAAPVRGPVDISTIRWWWIIGATVATAVCMWLARLMFWRSRDRTEEPPLPADAWALREMDRLEAEHLPSHGDIDGFFARLSDIVRHYVEQRWGISAPEQTTKEFLQTARLHPELSGAHEVTLGGFLRTADMVKFAAVRPGDPECTQAMGAMRGFVVESAPVAEVAPHHDGTEPPPPLPPPVPSNFRQEAAS